MSEGGREGGREVSEEENGRAGGGGYRTKNKNPTRQCLELSKSKRNTARTQV